MRRTMHTLAPRHSLLHPPMQGTPTSGNNEGKSKEAGGERRAGSPPPYKRSHSAMRPSVPVSAAQRKRIVCLVSLD
jgi:hypothetical protein